MKQIFTCTAILVLFFTVAACAKSMEVRHDVTFSRKGTRSEARHGHLFINETKIPDCFTRVVTDKTGFVFLQRENLWGDDGYFPEEKAPEIPRSEEKITDAQLERGWYTGKTRLADTPDDWIFVTWGEESAAFVKIDAVADMIREESIPRLIREKMFGRERDF